MRCGAAIAICCDVPAQSRSALHEHFCHMNALMAFLQPAIRLLIDPSLHQRLFDIVMRYIESGRILSASFGSWQDRILIKILDGLFVYLHRRPESRIKIIVQENLASGQAAHIRFAEPSKVSARFVILFGSKTLLQALQPAIDFRVRWLWSARNIGFVTYNPLIEQAVQDL